MRCVILCLLVCCNIFAQKAIRFVGVDGTAKRPAVRIIDNQNAIYQESFPNRQGYVDLQISAGDSLQSYFVYLDDGVYDRVYEKIDPARHDTLTIKLNPVTCKDCKTYPKNSIVMPCHLVSLGSYKPTVLKTLGDLPDLIRVKVVDHLRNRVGSKFFKKVSCISGQLIDFRTYDETLFNPTIQRIFPNRYEFRLCFALSDVGKGLGAYTTVIRLDENGDLLNDIAFPRETGQRHELFPLDDIKTKATNAGHYAEGVDIEMQYDPTDNILVWIFRRIELMADGKSSLDEWSYNAQSGEFLDHRQSGGT